MYNFLNKGILSNAGFPSERFYGNLIELVNKATLENKKNVDLACLCIFLWLNWYDFNILHLLKPSENGNYQNGAIT